jgi:hypothetical protein
MQTYVRHFVVFTIIAAGFELEAFAQHPTMPPGMTHTEHLAQRQRDAELKKRGAAAMGFDQDATTHHFRLYESGGAIEVLANQPADQSTVAQVRAHLKEIAAEFARGDFAKPFATHAEMPPGVATMQQRQGALEFRFEETSSKARARGY